MLNDEARKALEQYNTGAKAKYKGTRAANTHEKASGDDQDPNQDPSYEPPSLPEPDLHHESPCDSFPQDDSELNISWTATLISTLSTRTHIYHISKYSSLSYGSFVDRGVTGGLAGANVHILE